MLSKKLKYKKWKYNEKIATVKQAHRLLTRYLQ